MFKILKLPFLMVFVNVSIHFRTDLAKVPDPCGSGSTTLPLTHGAGGATNFLAYLESYFSTGTVCLQYRYFKKKFVAVKKLVILFIYYYYYYH
jgi:hypothetical protein